MSIAGASVSIVIVAALICFSLPTPALSLAVAYAVTDFPEARPENVLEGILTDHVAGLTALAEYSNCYLVQSRIGIAGSSCYSYIICTVCKQPLLNV